MMANRDGHGPTVRETAILDRIEAGQSPRSIGAELGLDVRYVRQVATMYNGSWAANDAFDAMVRRGSIALAAATARSGGSFA